MIAYNIQHHGGDFVHLDWLVRVIAPHASSIDICLDSDSKVIESFSSKCRTDGLDNVRVLKSMPVIWAGPSVVNQMRDMLRLALENDKWEWLVNLSGSCVPLVHPQSILAKVKMREAATGKKNFCYAFEPKRPNYWLQSNFNDGLTLRRLGRIEVYMDEVVEKAFANNSLNPMKNAYQRRGIYCSEQFLQNSKTLYLRGLYRSELADRVSFYKKSRFLVGRQWVVLHRSSVEWLCSSVVVSQIFNFLSRTFCSDESFFQACLNAAPSKIRDETDFSWNFRYRLGMPGMLVLDAMSPDKIGEALFARKIRSNDFAFRRFLESQLWPSELKTCLF